MNIEELKKYCKRDESLRDYQCVNKQKIYDAWSRCHSVMLQMPTGTGKTKLFVSIIKDLHLYSSDIKESIKVLILVHRTELIEQIDEVLGYQYGLAHGIIQSGEKERRIYPIQLASVQTLSRRLNHWTEKKFDFIIVDEAHHITAASYRKIIDTFPDAHLLGVTATPVRLNGEGFTDIFEELIVSPSVKEFIEKGYLSNYEYYSVARSSFIQTEIDSIRKFSQGDYAESELERICDNDRIRAQVVQTYLDFANGKKGIVYTINKLHNNNLCSRFNKCGINAVAIDSDTPGYLREQYINRFRKGEIRIICNVNLFTEGFDCPDIEFIQLARLTKSLALYLQQVGRGLRISANKEKTIFLDNVGLYNRFGFPSSKRMWKLHFEGKYLGNVSEEDVEGKKDCNTEDIVKRDKHQNLEEGKEKVHLIQTTDEKKSFEHRKAQFCAWINGYIMQNVTAMNFAFKKIRIDGLGLRIDFYHKAYYSNTIYPYDIFHVYVKTITKSLKKHLKVENFYFFLFEGDKVVKQEYRTCKSYDELAEELDRRFHDIRKDCLKDYFIEYIRQYKELQFSEAELYDIINDIVQNNTVERNVPLQLKDKGVALFVYLLLFWSDTYHFVKRRTKSLDWILHATKDAIHILNRK